MTTHSRNLAVFAMCAFSAAVVSAQPPVVTYTPFRSGITPKTLPLSARQPLSPYLFLTAAGGNSAVNYQLFVAPAIEQRNQLMQPQIGAAVLDPKLDEQYKQLNDVTPLDQTGRPTGFMIHRAYNDSRLPNFRYVPYNPTLQRPYYP